jgi:hypothetical protein
MLILGKNITKTEKKSCGKKHCSTAILFSRKVTVFSSYIVTVIFNQLNIKKNANFGENH